MFYLKNVPTWERVLRAAIGIACLAYAALAWNGALLPLLAALTGATLSLTGLAGFCPMCALVGRKLDRHDTDAGR